MHQLYSTVVILGRAGVRTVEWGVWYCSPFSVGINAACVCVCVWFCSHLFWTSSSLDVPAGVKQRRKVTHDFSSTFFLLRCMPLFFSREGFSRSFPSSTVKSNSVYLRFNRSPLDLLGIFIFIFYYITFNITYYSTLFRNTPSSTYNSTICYLLVVLYCFKKNLNASKPSEHPPPHRGSCIQINFRGYSSSTVSRQ